jgi:hypothetical protein
LLSFAFLLIFLPLTSFAARLHLWSSLAIYPPIC